MVFPQLSTLPLPLFMPRQLVGIEELCGVEVRMHGRDLARFQSLAKATADALVHGASAAPLLDNGSSKSKSKNKSSSSASGDFYCADGPGAWQASSPSSSADDDSRSNGYLSSSSSSSSSLVSSRCSALASQWCLEAVDLWRQSPHSFRAQVHEMRACLVQLSHLFRVGIVQYLPINLYPSVYISSPSPSSLSTKSLHVQWLPNLEARALEATSDADLEQEDDVDSSEDGKDASGTDKNGNSSSTAAAATAAAAAPDEADEFFCLETGAGEVCPQLCKPSPGAAPPPRATLVHDYTASLQQALSGGANISKKNKGKTTRGPLRVEEDLSLLLSGEPGLSSLNYHRSEVLYNNGCKRTNRNDLYRS